MTGWESSNAQLDEWDLNQPFFSYNDRAPSHAKFPPFSRLNSTPGLWKLTAPSSHRAEVSEKAELWSRRRGCGAFSSAWWQLPKARVSGTDTGLWGWLWLQVTDRVWLSLSTGVLSQVKLEMWGSEMVTPWQTLTLACAVYGLPISTSGYAWNWICQAPGKGLESMGNIWCDGSMEYSPSLKSRTSISRDTSKSPSSLQLSSMTTEDTGFTTVQETQWGHQCPPRHRPPAGGQEGLQGALRACLLRSLDQRQVQREWAGVSLGVKDFLPLPSPSCPQGCFLLWSFCSGVHTLSSGAEVRTFSVCRWDFFIWPPQTCFRCKKQPTALGPQTQTRYILTAPPSIQHRGMATQDYDQPPGSLSSLRHDVLLVLIHSREHWCPGIAFLC